MEGKTYFRRSLAYTVSLIDSKLAPDLSFEYHLRRSRSPKKYGCFACSLVLPFERREREPEEQGMEFARYDERFFSSKCIFSAERIADLN